MHWTGKKKRLNRIFILASGRSVIVPLDDALIDGPFGGLSNSEIKINDIIEGQPNAILGFKGTLNNYGERFKFSTILNLTASTSLSEHTKKALVSTVKEAIKISADAVAVHVNISSKHEHSMLKILGKISRKCDEFGMPLMAIMYPRGEYENKDNNYLDIKENDLKKYTKLVCHAVRVGVEIGADIIKTQYTGSAESFNEVIMSACNVPVVIAGGPIEEDEKILTNAYDSIIAGGAGVCFGRNTFHRKNTPEFITILKKIVHEKLTPQDAMKILKGSQFEV